jgi:cardiolipin synthase
LGWNVDLWEKLDWVTFGAELHTVLLVIVIPFVLFKKRDPTVAVAWCLVVLLMPIVGSLLFWAFGFNYVNRRVSRRRQHKGAYREHHPPPRREATRGAEEPGPLHPLAQVARAVSAFPVSAGNAVTLYHDTQEAYEAILAAVAAARHHVHLEFFIYRGDEAGRRLFELLTEKARAGVEVRLLYDAAGSLWLGWSGLLRRYLAAGGKADAFLPVNPIRSWVQVNLRNHRKIVIVDGSVAFTGGMNIGDEYLGRVRYFGYWRDTMLRLEGPAVAGLQRVFSEDWDFAAREALTGAPYFPETGAKGEHAVQVVESGPDQEPNSIREVYFAAILAATKRLWIASPYFVPDGGMLDALRLARMRGVDVRLLGLWRPDHWMAYYAGRYYWADMLALGAHVYQYKRGMMHAKVVLVDDDWAMVGSANLDNRSLHLNFEIACLLYSRDLVAELARQYERDLEESIPLDPWSFGQRSFAAKLVENACRLFSPVL